MSKVSSCTVLNVAKIDSWKCYAKIQKPSESLYLVWTL